MKILITGFDPFGGETVNPAYEAVKLLPERIAGAEIVKLEIPTEFEKSMEILERAVRQELPDAVISVGQAGGRADRSASASIWRMRGFATTREASRRKNRLPQTGLQPISARFR